MSHHFGHVVSVRRISVFSQQHCQGFFGAANFETLTHKDRSFARLSVWQHAIIQFYFTDELIRQNRVQFVEYSEHEQ